jgi:hypothetical protein
MKVTSKNIETEQNLYKLLYWRRRKSEKLVFAEKLLNLKNLI